MFVLCHKHYQCPSWCNLSLIQGNQHQQHSKNEVKQLGTWKQDEGSQRIQGSKEREIKLISNDDVDKLKLNNFKFNKEKKSEEKEKKRHSDGELD